VITIYDFLMALVILLTSISLWYMLGRIAFLCLEEAVMKNRMKLIKKEHFEYDSFDYSVFMHTFGPVSFLLIIVSYFLGHIREIGSNIALFIATFCYTLRESVRYEIRKYQEERKNRWDK